MSHKHLITVSILTSLLLAVTAYGDSNASKRDADNAGPRSQPAAPVIHRGASVPAGLVQSSEAPGGFDGRTSPAEPVRRPTSTRRDDRANQRSPSGVSDRLLQMRRAVVYDDLSPSTPPARRMETTRVAPPTTGANAAMNRSPAGGPAASVPAGASDSPVQPLPLTIDQLPSIMKRPEVPPVASPPVTSPPVASPPVEATVQSTPPAPAAARPARTVPSEPTTTTPTISEPVATTPIVEKPPVREIVVTPITEQPSVEASTTSPILEQNSPTAPAMDVANEDPEDGVLITHQSPVLSVTTRGPKTIVVGKASSYVVDVTNRSEFDAKDVVVRMNIPHWVEIVQQQATLGSAHVQPDEQGDSALTWSVGRLSARGQEKLSLELIPRGSRPLDLGVTLDFFPRDVDRPDSGSGTETGDEYQWSARRAVRRDKSLLDHGGQPRYGRCRERGAQSVAARPR